MKKQTQSIDFHDHNTGEILISNLAVISQNTRKIAPYRRYAMINQDRRIDIALAGKILGREGLQVLLVLEGELDYNNKEAISQTDIGKRLGMRRQSVHTAIKRLTNLGIIIQAENKHKQYRLYTLNEHYIWKGSASEHNKTAKTRKAPVLAAKDGKQLKSD